MERVLGEQEQNQWLQLGSVLSSKARETGLSYDLGRSHTSPYGASEITEVDSLWV